MGIQQARSRAEITDSEDRPRHLAQRSGTMGRPDSSLDLNLEVTKNRGNLSGKGRGLVLEHL